MGRPRRSAGTRKRQRGVRAGTMGTEISGMTASATVEAIRGGERSVRGAARDYQPNIGLVGRG